MRERLPVDDSLSDESHKAVADLSDDVGGRVFRKVGVMIDKLLEIVIAYFLDDVVVMRALHDIEHSDYVLGLEQLQNLNLGEEGVLEVFVLVDCVGRCLLNFF
jgi:hypothetical protein